LKPLVFVGTVKMLRKRRGAGAFAAVERKKGSILAALGKRFTNLYRRSVEGETASRATV